MDDYAAQCYAMSLYAAEMDDDDPDDETDPVEQEPDQPSVFDVQTSLFNDEKPRSGIFRIGAFILMRGIKL